MAKLINKKVLNRHLAKHSIPNRDEKIAVISKWQRSLRSNKNAIEKEFQDAFLRGFFGVILDYTDLNQAEENEYTMKREPSTEVDATRPDGSLGFFNIVGDEQTRAVIELKGPKESLDKKQKRAPKVYGSPVEQAFKYANKYDGCKWVIVSNMIEIRLYKYGRGEGHYEEFLIPDLDQDDNFTKFHLLLSRSNLISPKGISFTERLTEETIDIEEDITTEFYNLYKQTRIDLFEHLKEHNPDFNQEVLFEKAQKFLDRIIFICFCEDLGLLPHNTLREAIKRGKDSFRQADTLIWEEMKAIFQAIDQGNPRENINAYNGGLFKQDKILQQLIIKNDFFSAIGTISDYDFDSELDVNILGHIFEQSISDIEEIKADIKTEEYRRQESKRKKQGIFYTPEYITKYIVENSVGKYLEDIKEELGYEELPEIESATSPQIKGKYKKQHRKFYEKYEQRLQDIKILDPACGSGAFLNQAFDYLLKEYRWIRNQRSILADKKLSIQLQDQVLKQILQDNLYGVDLNQESVEITKLSLWLKSANKNKPLANLDDNIKCGNSLIDDPEVAGDKAFDWNVEFPDIMANGGFDVVIGNPPYIRTHNLSENQKKYYSKKYISSTGQYDIYVLFYEKSLQLLKNYGILSFITSNKFLVAEYGTGIRNVIYDTSKYVEIINVSSLDVFSDAAVYPFIIILQKNTNNEKRLANIVKYYYNFSKWNEILTGECNVNEIPQDQIDPEENYILNVNITKNNIFIFDKLDNDTVKIKDVFEITRGFRPPSENLRVSDPDNNISGGYEKYLSGKDVNESYLIKWSGNYVRYVEDQIPESKPIEIFKYPKILFKDVGLKLNASFDDSGFLCLKTIYFIYQAEDKKHNLNMKYLLALLNSKLLHYYFKSKFEIMHIRGGYLRFRKQFVEELPIKDIDQNSQNPLIILVNKITQNKNKLYNLNSYSFSGLIKKYTAINGPTLSTITSQSQFFNQIYTGRARKVRPLTVNINDNILTVYAEKSGSGLYELFKFQIDDEYQRQYIQLYLENLTEEQLEKIDNYSGNLPEKVLQIEIPDYNKPNVIRKVIDEWQALQDEIESLENKIEQTDREIDRMVYELYGLTDEEIEIVESSVG